MTNLRNFTANSPVSYCFSSPINPMVQISRGGVIIYHKSYNEKINALKKRKKTDKFIIAWAGQWSTDVFELTENDIKSLVD